MQVLRPWYCVPADEESGGVCAVRSGARSAVMRGMLSSMFKQVCEQGVTDGSFVRFCRFLSITASIMSFPQRRRLLLKHLTDLPHNLIIQRPLPLSPTPKPTPAYSPLLA